MALVPRSVDSHAPWGGPPGATTGRQPLLVRSQSMALTLRRDDLLGILSSLPWSCATHVQNSDCVSCQELPGGLILEEL